LDSLALKLIATPALIGAASLAGRRWGPAVSGSLVGLPLTSGPIVFFLALDHGLGFAAGTATGTLAGTVSEAAFCLSYAWLALRSAWPVALSASALVFGATTFGLQSVTLALLPLSGAVLVGLVATLRLMPRTAGRTAAVDVTPASWDIPARMIVATAFVLLLTGLATRLGPHLTGLLSPFPLYAAVLAAFAQHWQGPLAALQLLRGVLLGLFAFVGFFIVIALELRHDGLVLSFAAATAVALALQSASLWMLRRRRAAPG
jgi:hypothetical protein